MRDDGSGFKQHMFQSSEAGPASGSGAKLRIGGGWGFRILPGYSASETADGATHTTIAGFFPLRVKIAKKGAGQETRFVYGCDWQPEHHDGVEVDLTQPWAPVSSGYMMGALQVCESEAELLRAMAAPPPQYSAPQQQGSAGRKFIGLTTLAGYQRLDSGLFARQEITIWADDKNADQILVSDNLASALIPGTPTAGTILQFWPGRSLSLKLGANVPIYCAPVNVGDVIYSVERGS